MVKSSTRNHIYRWFSSKTCQFIDDFPNNIQVNDFPCKSQVELKFPTTEYPFFWKPRLSFFEWHDDNPRFPSPWRQGAAVHAATLGYAVLGLDGGRKNGGSPGDLIVAIGIFFANIEVMKATKMVIETTKMVIDTTNQWLEHGDLIQSTKMRIPPVFASDLW